MSLWLLAGKVKIFLSAVTAEDHLSAAEILKRIQAARSAISKTTCLLKTLLLKHRSRQIHLQLDLEILFLLFGMGLRLCLNFRRSGEK